MPLKVYCSTICMYFKFAVLILIHPAKASSRSVVMLGKRFRSSIDSIMLLFLNACLGISVILLASLCEIHLSPSRSHREIAYSPKALSLKLSNEIHSTIAESPESPLLSLSRFEQPETQNTNKAARYNARGLRFNMIHFPFRCKFE